MIFLVPTLTTRPLFLQRIRLDERDFIFRFDYNERQERYYLDISLPSGEQLTDQIKLVCQYPLTARYSDRRLFPGELQVVPINADDSPPKFGELGEGARCQMFYYDAAEFDRPGETERHRAISVDAFRDASRVWARPIAL